MAALEGFTLLRADPWKARARGELDASSNRRRSGCRTTELTIRELEVATLAASGSTNVQISAQLGTSPRTVAAHLSQALAKLQLTSRAGLRTRCVLRTSNSESCPGPQPDGQRTPPPGHGLDSFVLAQTSPATMAGPSTAPTLHTALTVAPRAVTPDGRYAQ